MYKGFQEAVHLPLDLMCHQLTTTEGKTVPALSASAARKADGSLILSLANTDLKEAQTVSIQLDGFTPKNVSGQVLTSKNANDFNDFDHPTNIAPADFKDAKIKKDGLTVTLPSKSIVVLTLK